MRKVRRWCQQLKICRFCRSAGTSSICSNRLCHYLSYLQKTEILCTKLVYFTGNANAMLIEVHKIKSRMTETTSKQQHTYQSLVTLTDMFLLHSDEFSCHHSLRPQTVIILCTVYEPIRLHINSINLFWFCRSAVPNSCNSCPARVKYTEELKLVFSSMSFQKPNIKSVHKLKGVWFFKGNKWDIPCMLAEPGVSGSGVGGSGTEGAGSGIISSLFRLAVFYNQRKKFSKTLEQWSIET